MDGTFDNPSYCRARSLLDIGCQLEVMTSPQPEQQTDGGFGNLHIDTGGRCPILTNVNNRSDNSPRARLHHTLKSHHKAPLPDFSAACCIFVLFSRVHSFYLCRLGAGICVPLNLQFASSKRGLVVIFSFDVIMHNGYFYADLCLSGATGTQSEL